MMQQQIEYQCQQHSDPFECPDMLVHYSPKFDEYGIMIHDGGSSTIVIEFCPWCGNKLPKSKREKWFEELEAMGFDDPFQEDVPEQYKSNVWYQKEKRVSLQTHDSKKVIQFESLYEVQNYFTFLLRVRSGTFQGEASFCVPRTQLKAFYQEIDSLSENIKGRTVLQDYDSDAFIAFEGKGFGQITVTGQVGGTHQEQSMRFQFESDQTILKPLQEQISELIES